MKKKPSELLKLLQEVFQNTYYERFYGHMPKINCKFLINTPSIEAVKAHYGEMDHLARSYYQDIVDEMGNGKHEYLWDWVAEDLQAQKEFYEQCEDVFHDMQGTAELVNIGRCGGNLCLYKWNHNKLEDLYDKFSVYYEGGKPRNLDEARDLVQDLRGYDRHIISLHKYVTEVFNKINVQEEADHQTAFEVAKLIEQRVSEYNPTDRSTHPKAVA